MGLAGRREVVEDQKTDDELAFSLAKRRIRTRQRLCQAKITVNTCSFTPAGRWSWLIFDEWLRIISFSDLRLVLLAGWLEHHPLKPCQTLFIFQACVVQLLPRFKLFRSLRPMDLPGVIYHFIFGMDLHPYCLAFTFDEPIFINDRALDEKPLVAFEMRGVEPADKSMDVPPKAEIRSRVAAVEHPVGVVSGETVAAAFPTEIPVDFALPLFEVAIIFP